MTTIGELLVLALAWRDAGPHTPPPPEIAALPDADRKALYEQADKVARTRGEAFARGLMEDLAQYHHDTHRQ